MERLEIGRAEGGAEAEATGRHAHDGQDGDRVHLHATDAVGDRVGMVAAEQIRHREAIVEEAEMEFPGLQRPADAAIILSAGEILCRERVAPGPDEVRAVLRLQEPHQSHLPWHRVSFRSWAGSLPSGPWFGKLGRLACGSGKNLSGSAWGSRGETRHAPAMARVG